VAGDDKLIRDAQLANMRQELLAPAGAIVGYGEIVREAAASGDLDEIGDDLDRVLDSARALYGAVDRLLDKDAADALFAGKDTAAVQKTLRHDLRTPINAIKGYGEMVLEDLDDLGGGDLRVDLERLLAEADGLLAQLDGIIDFSRADDGGGPAGRDAGADMFAELARSIRPLADDTARERETGRILVVDDIATNRDLLSRRLGQDGHQVDVAHGGRQALALVAAEEFDLVLLDLMMPDINGFEVLAQIKASPEHRDIPVIMISALDEVDSVIRCIEAGAEDYLPKPFNPVLLRARINACLERKRLRDRERLHLARIEDEKERHENLLLNILPKPIVGRLNSGETLIADRFEEVSVLFSDLVGFTEMSARITPTRLVTLLNQLFSEFDHLAQRHGVEKIKMIGDAYMAVAGVPEPRGDHADAIARMALDMRDSVARVGRMAHESLDIRIGIHSGPVVAGIIGTHRFLYDVWGDTVNVASRLETTSPARQIHISQATAERLSPGFGCAPRGLVDVKGKGELQTYFLAEADSATAPD
jgi:class 3 adenylate cyclase